MPCVTLAYRPEDPLDFLQYLVENYYDFMRWTAEKQLGNWADADEAVNGLWKSIWRHIDRLITMENGQLKAYLYRSAVNAARDLTRSHRKYAYECVSLESVEYLALADEAQPEEDAFYPEEIEWLKGWKYKPSQQRLISLVYYEGYTLKEAAQIMQITYGNARAIMSRSLNQIRRIHPDGIPGLQRREEAGHEKIQ